jgi:UDP-N-acetyl-D-glucosamine dehydrogenase
MKPKDGVMPIATDEQVAIIGLGYVGLPLAISFAEAGCRVVGCDADPVRVGTLALGRSPIDDISDGRLVAALSSGLSVRHVDEVDLRVLDAVFVCVPTPISESKDPDLGPVLAAAGRIRRELRPGHLIVLQSTTFPGTTMGPFREELERSSLVAGVDFDLAYAPERVNPGDPASASRDVPRLVGGSTPTATRRAAALLRRINTEVRELTSPDAAEMSKLLENVFRNVNIALVNQLALLCERMGLDVWEIVDAAATKPFGFMRFTPGPGVGGHCIPVDPYYLAWRARAFDFVDRFVELAGDINLTMPRHVVDLVAEALNERGQALKGARVGVLGVAFKPNVRDQRNSPAADVLAGLWARGATVTYHDPHVGSFEDADGTTLQCRSLEDVLDESDAVVVITPHDAIDWTLVYERARLVVDTTNSSRGRVRRAGQVLRLGAGWAPVEAAETSPATTRAAVGGDRAGAPAAALATGPRLSS